MLKYVHAFPLSHLIIILIINLSGFSSDSVLTLRKITFCHKVLMRDVKALYAGVGSL
jgi:hypothetical protein